MFSSHIPRTRMLTCPHSSHHVLGGSNVVSTPSHTSTPRTSPQVTSVADPSIASQYSIQLPINAAPVRLAFLNFWLSSKSVYLENSPLLFSFFFLESVSLVMHWLDCNDHHRAQKFCRPSSSSCTFSHRSASPPRPPMPARG